MEIQSLVDDVHLGDIWCIEAMGALKLDPAVGLEGWVPEPLQGTLNLQVHPVSWDERIELWFRVVLEDDSAKISVAHAVVYQREQADPIPDEVQQEFLERVAFMAVFPYAREAISRIATDLRLGAITLPIVRQGEVSIQLHQDGSTPTGPGHPEGEAEV